MSARWNLVIRLLLIFSAWQFSPISYALDPMSFRAGLCPGNPLKGALAELRPVPLAPEAQVRRNRDRMVAMRAAKSIYSLGDLENSHNGRELILGVGGFIQQKPAGYEYFRTISESNSGLKYVILKPVEKLRPWIIGIAGTQTALDWVADLDLGRGQFQHLSTEAKLLTTCEFADDAGRPLADHEWIVVGHSLGGGLAQAFAYEVQRQRLAQDLEPLLMQVVTFNAFGARPLIEKFRSFDEKVERTMGVTNFFITGDLVSRIGSHIGGTFELTPPGPASLSLSMQESIRRHAMDVVVETVSYTGLSLDHPSRPPEFKPLQSLWGAGTFLHVLAHAAMDSRREEKIVALLKDAVAVGETLDFKKSVNKEILLYLVRLIDSHYTAWNRPSAGIMAKGRLQELKRLQDRTTRLLIRSL